MDAIEMLKNYKKRVEPYLCDYFNRKIKEAKKLDSLAVQAVKMIADFTMAGGKRIRPALVYYGYLASGGKDGKEIIEASMGIELIHSFLLIHDDIIDRDKLRHGVMTVHEKYRKIGERISPKKDNAHFGNSMAIVAGDLAYSMANEIIFNAKFPPEIIIKALDKLQDIVYATIPGEMLDVVMENRGRTTEKEILRMFEGKTSRYTFEGPLHFGSILSGNSVEMLPAFSRYSLPLGKAFQLRDDILGVFGTEKKLGKSVGADVTEGKQTLLLIKALEKSNASQKKIIQKCLGKKDLSKNELEEFRQVIRETGSLEYCQNLSEKFVAEALEALKKIKFKNEEAKKFLEGIAQYIIKREV
ncbi:MAG TPA: polyprenyl synthetase family protein [Candidatus Moranbacteria bacterium]|nr:polyprenyl synthetase family protein [Candidatus Moranbacteria bacterium]